jgi:hypothetical protein
VQEVSLPGTDQGGLSIGAELSRPACRFGCESFLRGLLGLTQLEWLFVITAIGVVLSLRLLNTTIEKMLDLLHRPSMNA